ncbi:uncharacterized protein G2W53_041308 [Senna tora]|uniref:Uncharacterized protein n=1 Tax=Senna tora TaxID=362788 RepID=A0A834SFA1_9FABA|nr:uncharacterized protein G2W53_041308 [Senna tora]
MGVKDFSIELDCANLVKAVKVKHRRFSWKHSSIIDDILDGLDSLVMRIADKGADIVRITVQERKEADCSPKVNAYYCPSFVGRGHFCVTVLRFRFQVSLLFASLPSSCSPLRCLLFIFDCSVFKFFICFSTFLEAKAEIALPLAVLCKR